MLSSQGFNLAYNNNNDDMGMPLPKMHENPQSLKYKKIKWFGPVLAYCHICEIYTYKGL